MVTLGNVIAHAHLESICKRGRKDYLNGSDITELLGLLAYKCSAKTKYEMVSLFKDLTRVEWSEVYNQVVYDGEWRVLCNPIIIRNKLLGR
jgi:hypothetical protein